MGDTFATMHTSLGDIRLILFKDQAPKTVRNFLELAEGNKEWTDPRTKSKTTAKLYDGTIFHRVIAGFMIQGGASQDRPKVDVVINSVTVERTD